MEKMTAVFLNGDTIEINEKVFREIQMGGPSGYFQSPLSDPPGKRYTYFKHALKCVVHDISAQYEKNEPAAPLDYRPVNPIEDQKGTISAHPEVQKIDKDALKAAVYGRNPDKKVKFQIDEAGEKG
jgi:hypothetical protein